MSVLPPATADEGILGLEGVHLWNAGLYLNSPDSWDFSGYRYKLDRITGLYSRADRAAESEERRGGLGEIHYPGAPRGKTITYEGRVQAKTLIGLREAARFLRMGFNDMDDTAYEMAVSPPPARGGYTWSYFARILSCDVEEVQERGATAQPTPWQRNFTIGLRLAYPLYLGETVTHNGNADGATVAVTNPGTAPADPIVTIHGPVSGDIVITREPDATLEFTDVTIASGHSLVVNYLNRTALIDTTPKNTDVSPRLTFTSNGWDDRMLGLPIGEYDVTVDGGAWDLSFRVSDW